MELIQYSPLGQQLAKFIDKFVQYIRVALIEHLYRLRAILIGFFVCFVVTTLIYGLPCNFKCRATYWCCGARRGLEWDLGADGGV